MSDLADLFKEETKKEHVAAERSLLMRTFLKGCVRRDLYVAYLTALEPIYLELEMSMRACASDPVIGDVADERVFRWARVCADRDFLLGDDGVMAASVEAERYAARLRTLRDHNPRLLIAHAYTRFLGDLSGGRILRRFVAAGLGLRARGLSFYDYDVADLDALKRDYRARFASGRLGQGEVEALVAEAKVAFELNGAVFRELSEHAKLSMRDLIVGTGRAARYVIASGTRSKRRPRRASVDLVPVGAVSGPSLG